MKTKLILSSLALAALAAGCSQDEFETINNGANGNQAGLIELSENFMIGGAGVDDATTRTHWDLNGNKLTNVYMPIALSTGGNNEIAVSGGTAQLVLAPSIGLCWLGQTPGEQVYTNYEFFHNGWLGKNQENATFDECDDAVLTNGWLYSDLSIAAAVADGTEIATKASDFTEVNGGKKDAQGKALDLKDMNLNSGVYKTCNKAIFGGDYIAYYPYNPDFKDAGTIPATSEVAFKDLKKNDAENLAIAENTFRYSNVAHIDGGAMAKGFGFNNLSGVIRLVLKSAKDNYSQKVKKVLLYSPSSKFLTEVHLSAAKIAAGAEGTALYASQDATSKTIVADMATGEELSIAGAAASASTTNSTIYLTALPTTIDDMTVLAQATDGTWAESKVGTVEIAAGAGTEIVAKFSGKFENVYYAVDEASLTEALAKAQTTGTAQKPAIVKVLGDIVLTKGLNYIVPSNVVVEGDKIIVPEDAALWLLNNSTVKSDIVVKGQECCTSSTNGGLLRVAGATIDGDLTIEASEDGKKKAGSALFEGNGVDAVITANSVVTTDGDITINEVVDVRGAVTVNKSAKVMINNNGEVNVKGGTLVNDGTIEVDGKFAMLDAQGTTVASAGLNMTNNGTFIDNVGSTIGGATQYMNQNGKYICKVDSQYRLDEAYKNKTACSIIQFESDNNGSAYEFDYAPVPHYDKDVDIIVNATGVEFDPQTAITIGNLTINASKDLKILEAAEILGSNGRPTGEKATIEVNGNIVVNGSFETADDVVGMTANNMTVNKNGKATFGNRTSSMDKTLEVSGTIEVKKDGSFIITNAAAGQLPAYITCTKLIEGGNFTGKPEVIL